MSILLLKFLITGILTVFWWRFKRYMKDKFSGSLSLWTYSIRFTHEVLGKSKLKLRHTKEKGMIIVFKAENLNKGTYDTLLFTLEDETIMALRAKDLLNARRKVERALEIEPVDGNTIEIKLDDEIIQSDIFSKT